MESLAVLRGIFLADEINYYGSDTKRRASVPRPEYPMGQGFCMYKHYNGNKCQMGRYISDNLYELRFEGQRADFPAVLNAIPYEIRELGSDFLVACQNLHDRDEFWDNTGLTMKGNVELISIINQFECQMPPLINDKYVIERRTWPPVYIEDFLEAIKELQTV